MAVKVVPRRSYDRGHSDHGWLKTFHTFGFAAYNDPENDSFGCLRVINEDRVEPKTGFGMHAHAEFEIFSYVIAGELEHCDSMGNIEILKRGDLQMTSAGTGIRHSEKCHGSEQVHFLQIWSIPSKRGLTPQYFNRHFSDEEKKDKWVRVVAPADTEGVTEQRFASGPAPVHSPLSLFATLLSPSAALSHTFPAGAGPKKSYVHVAQTSGYNPTRAPSGVTVHVTGEDGAPVEFREGDGAYVTGEAGKELKFENMGDRIAEIVLFDLE